MTTFIKTSDGLKEVGRSKIRNYDSIACVQAAIDSGELKEDDLFTTVAAHGITEDIEAVINCLVSITPSTASTTNMLVTQDQLNFIGDLTNLCARVGCNEANIAANATAIEANTSLINQLGARVGVNETNICDLQCNKFDKSTFNTFYNNEYVSLVTSTNSAIGNLTTCKVDCSDYEDYQLTLDNCFTGIDNSLSSLCSCVTSIETSVCDLQNCAGLSCVGTVTGITLNNNTCNPDSNGVVELSGVVTGICSCAGQTFPVGSNGQVTLPVPVFALDGTVLTITV